MSTASSRPAQLLALIDDPSHPPLGGSSPLDGALLGMLVHLAYSDGIVQDDELALMSRLRPDLDVAGVLAWAASVAQRTFDANQVAAVVRDPADRWATLRLATRMVCMDGEIAEEEAAVLRDLAEVFELPADAPDRAVREVVAKGGAFDRERVATAVRNMLWDRITPTRDEPEGPLASVIPPSATFVCTMSVDDDEVAVLCFEGIAAAFDRGPAFVRWTEIRSYTRVPVPGASFHLRTTTQHYKMGDPRMRDVGRLLDFIFGREAVPEA